MTPRTDDPGNGITEAAVENRYAALVRGPSAIFPRGYLWLIPVWYVTLAALAASKDKLPSWSTWYGPYAVGATLVAACTLVVVLSTVRNNAFLADENGIWLGLRGGARRRFGRRRRDVRYLSWPEMDELKIARRHYGARLDILLAAGTPADPWGDVRRLIAAVVTLIIPPAYLFRSPGIVHPRSHRYRIALYDVRPEELRLALLPLAPPTLAVAVLPRWYQRAMRRLRGSRRSRLTTAA
jgi:hypothetical protein